MTFKYASLRVHASRKSKSCFPSQPEYSNNTTEANVDGCKLEQNLDDIRNIFNLEFFFFVLVCLGVNKNIFQTGVLLRMMETSQQRWHTPGCLTFPFSSTVKKKKNEEVQLESFLKEFILTFGNYEQNISLIFISAFFLKNY